MATSTSRLSVRRGVAVGALSELAVPVGVILALLVYGFYHAYRYPLRINSTTTSPTYSDTPIELQVAKYVILAVLAVAVVAIALRQFGARALEFSRRDALLVVVAVYVVGRAGVGWLRSDSFTALDIVAPVASAIPFVVVAALWLARAREGERSGFVEALWLTAVLFLVVNAVANLVQVVLWKATGRLPALAFEDGVVRFGGVWDDPNSSAAYAAAMGLALVAAPIRTSVAARVALGWCVLFNLVVAWSYAAVVLVVFALACFYLMERWRLVLAAGVLASAVLVGLLTLPPDTAETPAGGLGRVAEAKQASTEQRTRLETYLETPSGPGEWLVGKDQPGVVESAFGNWLTATGLVGLVLAAAWLFLTLRVIWRSPQRRWATALIVGVLASSVFIPHIVVFPVGAFFVFAIGLMASFYEREPSRAIQPAGP